MKSNPKIGVFLCKCGNKIEPLVDLKTLKKSIDQTATVACCEILPYPCLEPGFDTITNEIRDKDLNRVIVAGCEGRLMLKKFEKRLASEGFLKGQIDIVNLRGHVAGVSKLSPEEKAEKGAKLIKASIAEMEALHPSIQRNVRIEKPPIIIGGGMASFSTANELARQSVDCMLSLDNDDPEEIMRTLSRTYPGEHSSYDRFSKIIEGALNNPHVRVLPKGDLAGLAGITGAYTLAYTVPGSASQVQYEAGTVIACLDGELTPPGPEFGYDGRTVLCQPEFDDIVYNKGIPDGQTVFWISDYETGQPENAALSARSAWNIGRYMMEKNRKSRVVILYNEQMTLPLSAPERSFSRRLGLIWVPYDNSVPPILQTGFVNFGSINDHVEHELPWDRIILSPVRKIGRRAMTTAKILGIVHEEKEFIGVHHHKVRPEMVGREETYLAGSARYACDLNEAINQGKKAGKKNAEMIKTSISGELFVPQVVCVVDPQKCVGCGQCQELCDCGGIGVAGEGGGLPRVVDPMLCTGGGTCAAACPYGALTLQNNTNDQREARVAALASQMAEGEFIAYACSWAGLPAADIAGNRNMAYNPNIHILGVPCLGQIDPSVMARAFMEGAPGLLLVGCVPEDCHHSFGVDHAWSRVNLMKKLFALSGIDRRRIAIAHADMNHPEEFIKTVESFSKAIKILGPIEKTSENMAKLDSIYRLVKSNSRVRLLLSSGLRRPWEKSYRGDQRFALAYDREDFMQAIKEELVKSLVEGAMLTFQKPCSIDDVINAVSSKVPDEEQNILALLHELVSEGIVNVEYKKGKPFYLSLN